VSLLETRLKGDRLRLFDVGARGGIDARWHKYTAYLEVVAFEPDPEECAGLNRAAASLPYPVRFINGALWREARSDVPFHVANWEVASSLYPPNAEFLSSFPDAAALLATKERRSISTTTLDEVHRTEGLAADCLKLDVEGAELDVLVGGEGVLGEALVLEVEVEFSPVFRGQPMFWDVDAHLRERGWRLLGLRRNSWRRTPEASTKAPGYGGQLIAADALYVNESAISGDLELNRELKLLVMLAAYFQWDLVLDRLKGSPALAELSDRDRAELTRTLIPRTGALRRVLWRLTRRLSSDRRRALADALQRPDARAWQDPHFF
jgi:FkbM family methyltransferase